MSRTEEEVRAQMFKDFTFKPTITELPTKIYGNVPTNDRDTPFYERVTKWKKDRDAQLNKQKSDVEGDQVAECTFKPRLNRNSLKAVEEIRLGGEENDKDVVERLQKKGEMAHIQRNNQEKAEHERVIAEEKKYCTFRPQLTRSNLKKFNKDKKLIKKWAKKYTILLATDALVKKIPVVLGPVLNRIGMFPQPVTHQEPLAKKLDDVKASVKW